MRVLMVTCEWPDENSPHHVPFIVRQVDFLRRAGVDIDVFSFRGARNPMNYLRAWAGARAPGTHVVATPVPGKLSTAFRDGAALTSGGPHGRRTYAQHLGG